MKIIIINAMWCPGCLISKSIWNEIKLMYPNIEYINYDYDLDEENIIKYNIGDIVRTKKQHPCGSKLWEITRIGVDFKLKCLGCGHIIVLERPKALKMITKKIEK